MTQRQDQRVPRALAGLRVVELGCGIGASYATKLMADLGADVVKIEPLGGDPLRQRPPLLDGPGTGALFAYLATSKKSLTIDDRSPEGQELVRQVCRQSSAVVVDVDSLGDRVDHIGPEALVASGLPGALALVVGLRTLPPDIEYEKGTDIQVQALTGLCQQMGEPDRHPLFWPFSQGSYHAGLVACIAVLGLLWGEGAASGPHGSGSRQVTGVDGTAAPGGADRTGGRPANVAVSTYRVLAALMQGHGSHVYRYFGTIPGRYGSRAVTRAYPTGLFRCQDGLVSIHSADDVMWHRLGAMMGDPAWVHEPAFSDRPRVARESPEVGDRHLLPWLATKSREGLFAEALARRMALAPVFTNLEVATSEHLEARGFWHEVGRSGEDSVRFPGAPYRLSRSPWAAGPAPRLAPETRDGQEPRERRVAASPHPQGTERA